MTTFLILAMLWVPIAGLAALTIGWALGVLDPEAPPRTHLHVVRSDITVIHRPYDWAAEPEGDVA